MAFFISGGNVSTHCTEAERCFAKSRNGERIFFSSSGVKSGMALVNSRYIVLPMHRCSVRSHCTLQEFGAHRLIDIQQKAIFAGREVASSLGKFARHVADQVQ